jgi:hypothetical protein
VKKRLGLPSVGETGGEEDEEMGELPVLEDDEEQDDHDEEEDEEEGGQDESKEVEDHDEDEQEGDHSIVEAAQDAADDAEVESGEEEGAGSDSWDDHDGEDEGGAGDYDMSLKLREGELALGEEDASFDVPVERGEEEEEDNSALLADGGDADNSVSFTHELSVEEELEEQSIDRELSLEPRDEDEEEEEQEEEEEDEPEREVLQGTAKTSILNLTRTCESQQARSSSSGRWDKPLRPSDFGQSSSGFARSRSLPISQSQDVEVDEAMVDVEDDASSSGDEGESLEEGVVTIISNDPLAAARAAAILKLVSLFMFN